MSDTRAAGTGGTLARTRTAARDELPQTVDTTREAARRMIAQHLDEAATVKG